MSLVARLYVLVALAVLPAIVIQGLNELSLRRDREAEVHEEALRLAEFAASEVNGLLEGAETLLVALARAPSIRQRETAACNRLLRDLSQDLVRYTGLGVVDRSGRWLIVSNQEGGNLTVFAVDPKTGELTPKGEPVPLPKPMGVAFLD